LDDSAPRFRAAIGPDPCADRDSSASITVVLNGLSRPCLNLGPTALVVIVLGDGLMPTAPVRPGQDMVRRLLDRQDHAPEEPTNLLDT
jgi:hypothetical protein